MPEASESGEPGEAESGLPVDTSIVGCPDPKNCTPPLAPESGGLQDEAA